MKEMITRGFLLDRYTQMKLKYPFMPDIDDSFSAEEVDHFIRYAEECNASNTRVDKSTGILKSLFYVTEIAMGNLGLDMDGFTAFQTKNLPLYEQYLKEINLASWLPFDVETINPAFKFLAFLSANMFTFVFAKWYYARSGDNLFPPETENHRNGGNDDSGGEEEEKMAAEENERLMAHINSVTDEYSQDFV